MLKLDKIISLLPQPWPRHAPANGAHIERAMHDPVSAAVIGTNPGRFPGICGVPRYFYPEASTNRSQLSAQNQNRLPPFVGVLAWHRVAAVHRRRSP